MPGRPPKLNPAKINAICRWLRQAVPIVGAARLEGVGRSTLMLWFKRGRDAAMLRELGEPVPRNERIYLDLLDRAEVARAECEAECAMRVRAAGRGDWHASAWLLTHSFKWRAGDEEALTAAPASGHPEGHLAQPMDEAAVERLRDAMVEARLLPSGDVYDVEVVDDAGGEPDDDEPRGA